VDLNPIRAGIAETSETFNFNSAQDRIVARQARKREDQRTAQLEPAEHRRCLEREKWSCPMRHEPNRRGFLAMDLDDYLALLDWTGRKMVEGKKGSIPEHLAPILRRLDIEGDLAA